MELAKLIEAGAKINASDIHLMEDSPPYFRVDGRLHPVKHPPVTHEDMMTLIESIVPPRARPKLEERRGVDVGYQYKDIIRCRVIIFFERHRIRGVFRLIPMNVPTTEEMALPSVLKTIADLRRGMILVTGPTGSGKTTTLAAMIDHMNTNKKISITTIEDPIEFIHKNKSAIISQREVGDDIANFTSGLVQALRQDPDVIFVGEMRDIETIRTAITASETGHLVLSTLHTTSAVQTIDRIIGTFPEAEHDLLRDQLSSNLKAVVTQNLVRRTGGKGRIAALEIMIVNIVVAKLIKENRINDIYGVMKGGEDGMQVFDQALALFVRENKIAQEDGEHYARDIYAYRRYIKGVDSSSDRGGIIGGFIG